MCIRVHNAAEIILMVEDPMYAKLADAIRLERIRHGQTQESLAAAAGLSPRTISHLESRSRRTYDDATLSKVEHALGWQHGACRRVLAGQPPTIDDPEFTRLSSVWSQLGGDVQYVLATVAELSAARRRRPR
ncbi:MAG: helix-turn-helix transcriptional regulator [Pseudonocardiaceae bacterium]